MDKGGEGSTELWGWTNEYKEEKEGGEQEDPSPTSTVCRAACGGEPRGPCLKALSPRLAYQFKIKRSSL